MSLLHASGQASLVRGSTILNRERSLHVAPARQRSSIACAGVWYSKPFDLRPVRCCRPLQGKLSDSLCAGSQKTRALVSFRGLIASIHPCWCLAHREMTYKHQNNKKNNTNKLYAEKKHYKIKPLQKLNTKAQTHYKKHH
jgi:hypothetical protein